MKLRRILAGVLSAAMVLTCAPVSALAEGGEAVEVVESTVDETGGAESSGTAGAESASVGTISGDTITYTDIDLENENSYKITNSNDLDYFNKMQGFTLTIIGKRGDNSENKPYALFTLKGTSQNAAGTEVDSYATMWYNPQKGYSCIAYNISGSKSESKIMWGSSAAVVAAGKYFKYNISFSGTGNSATCISCTNNVGKLMTMKSTGNFDATGFNSWLTSNLESRTWKISEVLIGKGPGSTHYVNTPSNNTAIVDFVGEIDSVTVSKTSKTSLNDLKTLNTQVTCKADLDAAIAESQTLNQNNYTSTSWAAYQSAVNATPTSNYDWDVMNVLGPLRTARSNLEDISKLREEMDAAIGRAQAHLDLGSASFVSGYTELQEAKRVAEQADVSAMDVNLFREEIAKLERAIDDLVFVDKIYTNVANGDNLYRPEDTLFYSNMDSLTYTVVFKYNTNSHDTLAPLVTFRNDSGQYVTLYYGSVTENNGNGKIAVSYPNSLATGFTLSVADGDTSASPNHVDSEAQIKDNAYHKLTISFEEGEGEVGKKSVVRVKLDNNDGLWVRDAAQASNQSPRWFQSVIDLMNENKWTHVEIGRKTTDSFTSNASEFPDATIAYVQISRNACDKAGVAEINESVNDEIAKERDALVTELTEEKEELVSNGVAEYYTEASWSEYERACTEADAAGTDWEMLNKIDALKTAKKGLRKKSKEFENCNIALSGKIDMNFYTTVAENDTTKTPRFTSGGKTLEPVETAEGGKKVYTVKLPAKEMTDEITVEMYDETSGTIVDKVVYSIEDYAKELLKNDAYSSEMKALVKSMLNYGAAAQTQFGYHTDDLANKSLNDTDKNVGAIGNALDTFCGSQYITAENCVGYSLVLEAETALKLYFKDTNSSQITVKKGDALVEDLECGESNGLTYVKVPNIKAQNLNNVYTVYIGTDEAGTVSALTYCYQVAKGTYDAKLTNLVNALYDYNKKACAFVDSQQTSAD